MSVKVILGHIFIWTNPQGGCIQLLKHGKTEPGRLDSYYWARAASNPACTSKDQDNGIICELHV